MAPSCTLITVGHRQPSFKLLPNEIFVGQYSDAPSTKSFSIMDDALGEIFSGKVLAEYFYLFYIFLSGQFEAIQTDYCYLSQYRKFVSTIPGSRRPPGMQHLYSSGPAEADTYRLSENAIVRRLSLRRELFGPVFDLRLSLLDNYAKKHLVGDFVAFAISMSKSGIFSESEISRFLKINYLIATPSLGLLKTRDLISDLYKMRVVWRHFYAHFYMPRPGYQRRVGGFLLERLHSFLILQRISLGLSDPIDFGYQFVVSEGDSALPTT
jgi:hypothetical protein